MGVIGENCEIRRAVGRHFPPGRIGSHKAGLVITCTQEPGVQTVTHDGRLRS